MTTFEKLESNLDDALIALQDYTRASELWDQYDELRRLSYELGQVMNDIHYVPGPQEKVQAAKALAARIEEQEVRAMKIQMGVASYSDSPNY